MSARDRVILEHGDVLEVLARAPDCSVDAVVTDPPYALEFMGRAWDRFDKGDAPGSFQHWCQLWAAECLRVLKPGGHLLAFGGSRTWHRLAAGIEDAGFEVRDSIAWLYGSGFPKSLDVARAVDAHQKHGGSSSVQKRRASMGETYVESNVKGMFRTGAPGGNSLNTPASRAPEQVGERTPDAERWQGWGTALKPAFEPIVVARKPLAGTVAVNVLAHGTGALNIDGCRVEHASADDLAASLSKNPGRDEVVTSAVYGAGRPQQSVNTTGRWPANVVLDESQAAALDKQSGYQRDGTAVNRNATGKVQKSVALGDKRALPGPDTTYGGGGGASRFFYVAKAPKSERPVVDGVAHPTVKPLALMRWLCRLVTPPGGVILEPFAGSGTTVEAALLEGFAVCAIEREAEYLPLIEARIARVDAAT